MSKNITEVQSEAARNGAVWQSQAPWSRESWPWSSKDGAGAGFAGSREVYPRPWTALLECQGHGFYLFCSWLISRCLAQQMLSKQLLNEGTNEWAGGTGRSKRPAWVGEEGRLRTFVAMVIVWKALPLVPLGEKTPQTCLQELESSIVITQA